MTEAGSAVSDYREQPVIPFKAAEFIPMVGVLLYAERRRRKLGQSFAEAYIPRIPKTREDFMQILYMNTYRWPRPADFRAELRAIRLAVLNVGFAAYHALSLPLGYTAFRHFTSGG